MTEATTPPRIFLVVKRMVSGREVKAELEVDLGAWNSLRYPGEMIAAEIEALLERVRYA